MSRTLADLGTTTEMLPASCMYSLALGRNYTEQVRQPNKAAPTFVGADQNVKTKSASRQSKYRNQKLRISATPSLIQLKYDNYNSTLLSV